MTESQVDNKLQNYSGQNIWQGRLAQWILIWGAALLLVVILVLLLLSSLLLALLPGQVRLNLPHLLSFLDINKDDWWKREIFIFDVSLPGRKFPSVISSHTPCISAHTCPATHPSYQLSPPPPPPQLPRRPAWLPHWSGPQSRSRGVPARRRPTGLQSSLWILPGRTFPAPPWTRR